MALVILLRHPVLSDSECLEKCLHGARGKANKHLMTVTTDSLYDTALKANISANTVNLIIKIYAMWSTSHIFKKHPEPVRISLDLVEMDKCNMSFGPMAPYFKLLGKL